MDLYKQIKELEEVRPIQEDETPVFRLSGSDLEQFKESQKLAIKGLRLSHDLRKTTELLKAHQVVLMAALEAKSERIETANSRGLDVMVREKDGQLVVVTKPRPKNPFDGIFGGLFGRDADDEE